MNAKSSGGFLSFCVLVKSIDFIGNKQAFGFRHDFAHLSQFRIMQPEDSPGAGYADHMLFP
jgi:hypothetical protein